MNLFDSIGLKIDPFTTSPNVELFYPAVEHQQCLEGLELAIRMRRGLSVVRGGIGIGKTTISRKLIQNFKPEADDFDFYLILDPKFESELILLKHLIELFGVNETGESVQECRNIIENYLLRIGVEQGKILVLIIDEGQNLPEKMLDVFRTLLNFETDDYKLLQLVIFGQPEMGKMMHKYPNFEDRISFDFEIGSLSMEDVMGMINHRINIAGGEKEKWFTDEALLKIYKHTQGYPRKITQLCHQLLMTMISEDKNSISAEMVQRVISGQIDTGGLLKQKKKNYNQVAANKLLDVLRKEKSAKISSPKPIEQDEDDWIGGDEPSSEPDGPEISTLESKKESKKKNTAKESTPKIDDLSDDESAGILPRPGKYPPYVQPKKIPIDNTILGVGVDGGRITSVLIKELKGIKTLLTYNVHSSKDRNLNPAKNPSEFSVACQEGLGKLIDSLSGQDKLHKSASKILSQKSNIALNVHDDRMLLKLVEVPKENKKEKNQIIEWAIKKGLPFPVEDAIIHSTKGYNNHFKVGVGDKSAVAGVSSLLKELDWEIRWWHPTSQAVLNAFLWNYPEHRQKTTLLVHIGESQSLILGCVRGTLRVVYPFFIGVQSLIDALREQGHSTDNWHERDKFQVPESFLKSLGIKAKPGDYDNIFRPIFDSWRQEIDRAINGIKRDFAITKDTMVLLSGSAGEILNLDRFIGGSLGLNTSYLNPIRNLAISPNENERDSIPFHPTLLTTAIGSALNYPDTVNVLPVTIKQNEMFRWANRISVPAAALLLLMLISITGSAKSDLDSINSEIEPLKMETKDLTIVQEEHSLLTKNRDSVLEQLDILNYDTEFFKRIHITTKFLSRIHNEYKQIVLEQVNFQQGWEDKKYKMQGRDRVQVIEMEDEDKRIVRIKGDVYANPALKEKYFNDYYEKLDNSGLFQSVNIIFQATKLGFKSSRLQFELKCIL